MFRFSTIDFEFWFSTAMIGIVIWGHQSDEIWWVSCRENLATIRVACSGLNTLNGVCVPSCDWYRDGVGVKKKWSGGKDSLAFFHGSCENRESSKSYCLFCWIFFRTCKTCTILSIIQSLSVMASFAGSCSWNRTSINQRRPCKLASTVYTNHIVNHLSQ